MSTGPIDWYALKRAFRSTSNLRWSIGAGDELVIPKSVLRIITAVMERSNAVSSYVEAREDLQPFLVMCLRRAKATPLLLRAMVSVVENPDARARVMATWLLAREGSLPHVTLPAVNALSPVIRDIGRAPPLSPEERARRRKEGITAAMVRRAKSALKAIEKYEERRARLRRALSRVETRLQHEREIAERYRGQGIIP